MTQTNMQSASPSSVARQTLAALDFRIVAIGLALLVMVALALSSFIPGDLAQTVTTVVFALLVMSGVLSLAALATGVIAVSAPARSLAGGSLLDELPEGVLVTGANEHVLYANPAYLALAGQEAGGQQTSSVPTIEELFNGKVAAAEPLYRLAQAIKKGESWQEEFRVMGSVATNTPGAAKASWYRISVDHAKKTQLQQGVEPVTIWQLAEISNERQRQEEAFGNLQEIIDSLDQAPAGFFSADSKGRINYLNATLADWLGLDLVDAFTLQLNLKDIVAGDGGILLAHSLSTQQKGQRGVLDLDLVRANGTLLPVRLLYQSKENDEGVVQSRILVLDRSRTVENSNDSDALRAAEARYARFLHSAPIAIATIDEKGVVGSINAVFARMFTGSVTAGNEGGCDIISLVDEENRPEVSAALERAARGLVEINPVNVSFIDSDAKTGRLFFSPAGNFDEKTGHELGGSILYAIDTTDQKSMEMQMVQGQKMQAVGQLAGGIAHDFNNLLTAIILGSDELLGGSRPTDPGFKDLISIKDNANRAASLVRQILAFSRQQTLRPEVLNLNDVVSNLSNLLNRLLGENVHLKLDRNRDLWLVRADQTQFDQVIINLTVNARDAMPAGGEVTITTRNVSQRQSCELQDQGMQAGEYVLIEVSDKGSGMTKEVREKVFEPFFTTKGVGKGTGLGLSMVYGIVKQTGGFIYIDSEVGKGTTFRIYLPRHEADIIELETQRKNKEKSKPDLTGTETILLVEDEEAVREFSARALRKRGYEVFEAGTGVHALEVMTEVEGRIDLVVSDVMMPEMDGPTMAREMRAANPELKIIFVSGYAQDVLDEEDDFIFMAKPYGLVELAAKVKEVLAG